MIKAHLSGLDGDPTWNLATLMRRLGYNEGLTFVVAKVTQVEPSVAIRLHGESFDLTEADEDIYVLDYLKKQTKRMVINGAPPVDVIVDSTLKVGGDVLVAQAESGQTFYVLGTI